MIELRVKNSEKVMEALSASSNCVLNVIIRNNIFLSKFKEIGEPFRLKKMCVSRNRKLNCSNVLMFRRIFRNLPNR